MTTNSRLQNNFISLISILFNYFRLSQSAFRETPASFLGEIHQNIILRCSYYQQRTPGNNEPTRINIEWLKADPQVSPTAAEKQPVFEVFHADRKRIFIEHALTEGDDITTNTSTIKIQDSRFEDMGKYKCIINKGTTFGGDESPVADVKLTPRVFIDPTIMKLDRRKDYVELHCNVSWLQWATPGFGRPDVLLNDDTTSCLETRIEWYAVTQERNWINPHDPSALESALEQRRPASTIPNVVIERDGRLLTIFTDVDDHYHNTRNFYERDNERKKSWRQLERDLIKITGIYWCEFQYCYEKQMQYQRAHAVVKYPIRMDSENMERQITGYIDDDVILECLVIGGPYYTIKWGRGNKTLSLNSAQLTRSRERGDKVRYFQFYRDPKTGQPTKLILKGVQYFDRAEYFCNATSFDGNEISASFMLRVKDRFTSYIPLGVIVGQVLLIFLLVFLTEKFFVHRSHDRLPKHNERFSALKAMEMTNTQPRRNLNDDLKYATVSGTLDRKQDTANYNTYQSAGNAII